MALNLNRVKILKMLFWGLITLIAITAPTILFLYCKGLIPTWLSNSYGSAFSEKVYSNSLAFVFSIIGFLIAVIIFLIQYISSKYHAEELDHLPVFIVEFGTTLLALCFFITFNFFAIFLELTYPYTLISLTFSVLLIGLIFTTILFAYYNTKVSTVLGMISEDIVKFIKRKKSFKGAPLLWDFAYSDEFISELNKKTAIFIKNSTVAIKNNQDTIFKSSLTNLHKITQEYLENSKHIQATEDKFLNELCDQFNFLIIEALQSSNQKSLEDIANTIGDISVDIIKYRKGIGDINNLALNWAATLKELFIQAYGKDRTVVCHICLGRINDLVIYSIDRGYYRSYDTYRMFIDEISGLLSKNNARWSAILLQNALSMYQLQFLKFLELAKNDKVAFSDQFIEEYFVKFSGLINTAKTNHTIFGSRAVIFASIYGIDPFTQKISKMNFTSLKNDTVRRNIARYLEQFIEFNQAIAVSDPDKNDNRLYDYFSETLFMISKYFDLSQKSKEKLIEKLSNDFVGIIEKKYLASVNSTNNHLSVLNEKATDYFAILIYLHNKNERLIANTMKKLADVYSKISGQKNGSAKERAQNLLYREIKIYSCWIDLFANLKQINAPIVKLLKKYFYEPSFPNRISPPSLFEKYGYPLGTMTRLNELWYLSPSYMWGNKFQDEISKVLNADTGDHYCEFHELLKGKRQRKKRNPR